MENRKTEKHTSPWLWIPSLYIGEGLPNVIVVMVAVYMYAQLGMKDTEIALYTSWLGLPWVIKPLWSPFVDLFKTKRWWVLLMQVLLGSSLAGVAFTLKTPFWFQGTMFCFFLMAFFSATHDIAADGFYMIGLSEHQQVWFVGLRNMFYRVAVVFGNVVLVYLAGHLQLLFRNKEAFTWSLVFYGVAGLFIGLGLFHSWAMPKADADKPRSYATASGVLHGIVDMLVSFFTRLPAKQMIIALLFVLFYRFPEALLGKMSTTFLLRPNSAGGLGLSPQEFTYAYGTFGVIGLILGGILGGWLASRDGLKKWLWPMVCAITFPDIVYVWMSYAMPSSLPIISTCLFIEQFGYGLGFTVLTLYMLYFCRGEYKTSHYAFCTGISYLGLMLPGMVSGYLKDAMGYRSFFILVMVLCTITFIVAALIKIDPEFGKKTQE